MPTSAPLNKPYRLGKKVPPYGKIVGIMKVNGERSYFLKNADGDIALMPAVVIEQKKEK